LPVAKTSPVFGWSNVKPPILVKKWLPPTRNTPKRTWFSTRSVHLGSHLVGVAYDLGIGFSCIHIRNIEAAKSTHPNDLYWSYLCPFFGSVTIFHPISSPQITVWVSSHLHHAKSLSFAGHLAISMRQIPKGSPTSPSPPAALKNHARGRNSHAALDSRATPRSWVHWPGVRKSGHVGSQCTGHMPKENRWRFLKVGYYHVLPPRMAMKWGKWW
jgi:hypothetical protein